MSRHSVSFLRWLSIFCFASLLAMTSFGQTPDYPSRPIKMVVTFPPGGSSDAIIRILSTRLNEKLGQPLVIDNRPGAGGNIGLSVVAKAAPDGYVLGVGAAGGLTANSSLYPQMPFEVAKDFAPITMLASIPFVLVGHPSVPAENIQQVIALARSQPGKVSIGHGGNGTAMHLSTALFTQMADIKLIEVPYRGSGPAAMDTLSGQIQLSITDLAAALPHIKAGKLKAFAVTSPKRLSNLPEVPTLSESGLTGYDSTGWFGLVAPAGTSPQIVQRLNAEFTAALNDEQIKSQMRQNGMEPIATSIEGLDAYIKSETQKWAKVIKQANIKLN
ncbi:tripartite tricarboxylate transporter substrate binding protein [Limnohabitans sp. 15K]|uniref:Bug family tripartite tricarboxylate transporter substrate binding protein n=1 Tax=Limnohabitans sp. 15K TaxID=1100706 RepID=UPI000C1F1091|nr:tripartite tricarboxylate transporter substrate binding protein [Limnohabitans sp. 15K]PIT79999.1 ABC transporter substrate-binding protein [Limnohabitans sp. 15K]